VCNYNKKQKLFHWKQEKKWFHRIITSTCGCWIYDVDAPEHELVGTHLQATSGLLGPMSRRMRYKAERKQMAEKYKLSYTWSDQSSTQIFHLNILVIETVCPLSAAMTICTNANKTLVSSTYNRGQET
jgi:cytochrome b561